MIFNLLVIAFASIAVATTTPGANPAPANPLSGNATSAGDIQPDASCKLKNDPVLMMAATSYWHCEGPSVGCLARVMLDVQANINAADCYQKSCTIPTIPKSIGALRDLAQKTWQNEIDKAASGPDEITEKWTNYMNLLANVVIQKSRFCRVDFDVLAHLSEMVAKARPCITCFGELSSIKFDTDGNPLNATIATNSTIPNTNSTAPAPQ
jgi:hypothetical protein